MHGCEGARQDFKFVPVSSGVALPCLDNSLISRDQEQNETREDSLAPIQRSTATNELRIPGPRVARSFIYSADLGVQKTMLLRLNFRPTNHLSRIK